MRSEVPGINGVARGGRSRFSGRGHELNVVCEQHSEGQEDHHREDLIADDDDIGEDAEGGI